MSETSMVERVTKAVRERRDMSLCALCDRNGHMIRCTCEEIARAAIEALREPPLSVIAAGRPHIAKAFPSLDGAWDAMIDAALSPNKETDR